LYILLFKRKTKWKQAGTLPVSNHKESTFFEMNKYLFLIIFFLFYLLLFYTFFHGKLGLMGNLARWRHDMRMNELCGILT